MTCKKKTKKKDNQREYNWFEKAVMIPNMEASEIRGKNTLTKLFLSDKIASDGGQ